MEEFDVVVVGGGPAGYVAAIRASQLGASVGLVEAEQLGGTCLNHGCIPTKTLIHNADMLREIHKLSNRGIRIADPSVSIDMKSMIGYKDGVVRKLVSGLTSLVKSHRINVIIGRALVKPDLTVEIDGKKIRGKKIILATGSEAIRPAISGVEHDRVLTNREILRLETLPQRLVIIGGGVIGVEMARIFSAFGTSVTILEMTDRLLPTFDDTEISGEILKLLRKQNVQVNLGMKVTRFDESQRGIEVFCSQGNSHPGTFALLATGRKADLSSLTDLPLSIERGFVQTDPQMQTNLPDIYAAGDINGKCMLAHAAFKMGEIAAENALGTNREFSTKFVPQILYGAPEVASVGMTENQAQEAGYTVRVGRFSFMANGRALASGQGHGFVKLICDTRYGEILGAQMIGPNVSELINEVAVLISAEVTAHELAESVHGHPSFSEVLVETASDALDRL